MKNEWGRKAASEKPVVIRILVLTVKAFVIGRLPPSIPSSKRFPPPTRRPVCFGRACRPICRLWQSAC